jgi:hypothetical protein
MSIGTAIFLSGLILGLVGLYAATRDRWRWRLFVKRIALGVGVMVLLLFAGGVGFYAWNQIPWPVPQQTEYARIKVGSTPDEVNYIKGAPSSVLGDLNKDPAWPGWQEIIEVPKIEKGKSFRDYQEWSWAEHTSRIDVTFDPDKKGVIAVQCFSSDKRSSCPYIEGIGDGSREDEVIKRFGEPDTSKITGSTRRLTYKKLGAFFALEQQVVYMLGVHDPKWKHE